MSERPPIAEIVKNYDETVAQLQELVSKAYPDATWSQRGESSPGAGPGESTTVVTSPVWYADAPVASDAAARDRLIDDADDVVRSHGFTDFSKVSATDGDFSFVTGDAWGGQLHLSGGETVTIRYQTGAHPDE